MRGGPKFLTQEQADRMLREDALRARRSRPSLPERLETLRACRPGASQPGARFIDWAEVAYAAVHAQQQEEAAQRRDAKPREPRKLAGEEWAELLEGGTVVRVVVEGRAEENRVRSRLINVGKRHGFRVKTSKADGSVCGERVA